jgi:ABC-2 type transport system permease protein
MTAPEPGTRTAFVFRPTASPQAAANWTPRQVALTNLRTAVGRAYPRIRGLFRERSWVVFHVLLPFLATSAFVFVYRALQAPPQYIGFVVLGGAMTAFWLNVLWEMGTHLWWEKNQGNLELYLAAPMHMMAVLFGTAIGGLVSSSVRALAVLVIATRVYGVTFQVDQWALLIAVFFLTLAALYGLGMIFASLFLMWGRAARHLSEMLVEPVYFVSGLNFPVGRLGVLGSIAISVIPLAVGLDAMRQLAFADSAYPTGTPSAAIEALILVGMAVVFVVLARWCLATVERRARREGRLSVRSQ